jgi:low temperature requirement protein LtrA
VILGGPALYIAGNALFKRALWGEFPRSRPMAILALAAFVVLALVSSMVILLSAATLVTIGVAFWDARDERISSDKEPTASASPTHAAS